jgi:hypothetical protein
MKNTYLCFFGDGRLWDNTPLVAAYPSGFSYFRPFRYRDAWIQDELRKEIDNESQRGILVGSAATLGMRFLSADHRVVDAACKKSAANFH